MINNEEELGRARQRLDLLKDELAILRYDVLPGKRRTHDLMCEYFVKRIDMVQAEIDAYQASRNPPAAQGEKRYYDRLESVFGDRGED